ncbi:MAG: outer membrane lipoprotein carrier protein LolA [Prevotellaceae bacterium]|jgi:outer membrane lipoprotein-sorting protein|nr:outer membrane lipoprotein carrier protein LolA [Prevotellaceae bacterium]
MKTTLILLLLPFACLSARAQSAGEADRQLLQTIKEANAACTSITAAFRQTRHLPALGENTLSEGLFYYRKPAQMAMKYTRPEGDVLLINGSRITLTSGGKERKISPRNARMEGLRTILAACLQGDAAQMGAAKITCAKQGQTLVAVADIDGKQNRSGISRVIVCYAAAAGHPPVSIQTIEPDGSYTLYELSGIRLNEAIPENMF